MNQELTAVAAAIPSKFDFGDMIQPLVSKIAQPGTHTMTCKQVTIVALKSGKGWGMSLVLETQDGARAYVRISLSSEKSMTLLGAVAAKLGPFKGRAPKEEFGQDLVGRQGQWVLKPSKFSKWADVALFD